MAWKESDIVSIAVSLCDYNNATKAGVIYGILSNWRGKYIEYIGEKGIKYKTMRKHQFKRLPKKPQYVEEVLRRANADNYQMCLWK